MKNWSEHQSHFLKIAFEKRVFANKRWLFHTIDVCRFPLLFRSPTIQRSRNVIPPEISAVQQKLMVFNKKHVPRAWTCFFRHLVRGVTKMLNTHVLGRSVGVVWDTWTREAYYCEEYRALSNGVDSTAIRRQTTELQAKNLRKHGAIHFGICISKMSWAFGTKFRESNKDITKTCSAKFHDESSTNNWTVIGQSRKLLERSYFADSQT